MVRRNRLREPHIRLQIPREAIGSIIADDVSKPLIHRILVRDLAIPGFKEFCEELVKIFESVRSDTTGTVATYIPELANVDPHKFGFSICTGTFVKEEEFQ